VLTAELLELGAVFLYFWSSLRCIKIRIVIYYRVLKFPHRAAVLLLLESDVACTSLNGHSAVKTKVWQRPSHCVVTNCIIYYIQCIHKYISAVIYIYIHTHTHTHTHTQITLWQHVLTVRHSSSGQWRTFLRYKKVSTQWHPILFTVKVKISNDELLFETETLNEWCSK